MYVIFLFYPKHFSHRPAPPFTSPFSPTSISMPLAPFTSATPPLVTSSAPPLPLTPSTGANLHDRIHEELDELIGVTCPIQERTPLNLNFLISSLVVPKPHLLQHATEENRNSIIQRTSWLPGKWEKIEISVLKIMRCFTMMAGNERESVLYHTPQLVLIRIFFSFLYEC